MLWCVVYISVALVVAASAFAATSVFRTADAGLPDHRGVTSAVAGVLWPAVLIGMLELAVLWVASRLAALGRGSGAEIAVLLSQG